MILVAGATGSLGRKIVEGLLERAENVRALVRPASDHDALRRLGASLAIGDLRDPASLARACHGVRTVISTASATRREDDTPENVDGRGTQALIDAARAAGAEHFILVSTIGASMDSPVPAFRAKGMAEEYLRQSGMDCTIVAANAFMDVWFRMLIEAPIARGEPVTLVGESTRRHSFVAERDLAAFIVRAVRNPAARNTRLVLGGPAAVTLTEVVQAYEDALGRSIGIRRVAPGDPIPGLPEPVWGLAAALDTFDSPIPMDEIAREYGVQLTSVQLFAAASPLVGLLQGPIPA